MTSKQIEQQRLILKHLEFLKLAAQGADLVLAEDIQGVIDGAIEVLQ